MPYVKTFKDVGVVDPDLVIRADGVQIRRAATPEWAAYQAWLAAGNAPLDTLPPAAWAKLNRNARARCGHARPAGAPLPLPVVPDDPPAAGPGRPPRRPAAFRP